MYKSIFLKRGKEESLLRFHPWVFSGAIDHCVGEIADGDVVDVFSAAGDFIAVGHFQKGTIAVRVLAFDNVAIDHDFWVAKLSAALNMRKAVGIADSLNNDTFRLVHGEGD